MDKKFEGKPAVRDIEICKQCLSFKRVNDPIKENDGWHWGVGVYCNNFPRNVACGWCAETPHAVTEEEFVRAKNTMLIKTNVYSRKNNRS